MNWLPSAKVEVEAKKFGGAEKIFLGPVGGKSTSLKTR